MVLLHDDFTAPAGPLGGRAALTGQVWADTNDSLRLDGSGRLIRNPATEGSNTGSYAYIDAGAPVTRMWSKISFNGTSSQITENGSCVLISGDSPARGNNPPTQGIFHRGIHAIFGLWQADVSIWENDASVQPNLLTYTYPAGPMATDGTVYDIGLYFDGARLGMLMPDGVMKWAGDPRIPTYTGRYLIYQVYDVTAPNLRPRHEEVWADNAPLTFGTPGGRLAFNRP